MHLALDSAKKHVTPLHATLAPSKFPTRKICPSEAHSYQSFAGRRINFIITASFLPGSQVEDSAAAFYKSA